MLRYVCLVGLCGLLMMRGHAQSAQAVSLDSLPDDYFTLQLIALPDRAAMERFVAERGVSGLMASPVIADGQIRYALFSGVYESREVAAAAAENLPAELADLSPWIRPISSLKRAIPDPSEALSPPP